MVPRDPRMLIATFEEVGDVRVERDAFTQHRRYAKEAATYGHVHFALGLVHQLKGNDGAGATVSPMLV